ncbi:MAG: peptidase S9 [Gemmatirosa sp.]
MSGHASMRAQEASRPGRAPFVSRAGRRAAALMAATAVALSAVAAVAAPADAQYFGRNKVNYETFDFRILATPRFDVHYYPSMEEAASDAGRMAERWYTRLAPFMRDTLGRRSLIFFADQPDFQQNNVTDIESEGTGGVTESFRSRVIMPFTGVYEDNHHVLGHELVHVFQYDLAEKAGGVNRLNALPLWLVEGMAEYLSLGREDVNTATWLRDAARRDDVPTIKQLTTDPRYFPYRYGQALWAYVGGRWGDQAVVDVYRQSLRYGFEGAIRRVLDISTDQLSKDWGTAIKGAYLPLMAGRTAPDSTARLVLGQRNARGGEYNLAPVLSPDGRFVAFYSSRGLFEIDLFIAEAETGRVVQQLGSLNRARHFDAMSFIASAGSWSPDGRQLAHVVYREGDQVIEIHDLDRRRSVRTLRTPNLGAALDPAWSPDGRYIAFSGNVGGISDLYLYDLQGDRVEQLTRGREAELQPAWSPDGRTLAFVTDRGPGTDFERMTFAPMRLATMDVASREIRVVAGFTGARHINPNFSPDGRSLYFVADPDGFSDVYRLDLASGARSRVTRTSTGVSGITDLSPALSVARGTGRVSFTVFDRGGYNIVRLEAGEAQGTPVDVIAGRSVAEGSTQGGGGTLPPVPTAPSVIERYLADATAGLPANATAFRIEDYNAKLRLDYIAPPTIGIGTSSQFGTSVGGGIAAAFSDNLGNRSLQAVVQAQGQVQDIGGQLFYLNRERRWNWGAGIGHIPILTGYTTAGQLETGQFVYRQVLQRIFIDQAQALAQYPLSRTRRFEFALGATRQGYSQEALDILVDDFGNAIGEDRTDLPSPDAIYYGQGSAAFVGDWTYSGFTSPIAGGRYRFEVSPTVGTLTFTTGTADYRRYFLARPVTFAFRGMHYGRYGRDAEDSLRLAPLYAGYGTLIRGYDVANNIEAGECGTVADRCPVFDRLIGSRLAVANIEMRIPLLGPEGLGLIRTNLLPVEIAPFFDAGVTWNRAGGPDLRFVGGDASRSEVARIPVFSTGIAARINVLGFAVVEAFYAYPFQRPDKGAHFGFQLAPGW